MPRPSCTPPLWQARACSVVLLIVLRLVMPACEADEAGSAPTEIKEDFTGGDFDHTRWALNNTSVAVTKTDFSRAVFRLVVPPGPDMRPLVGLSSRFGLEGDFDVSVDYAIRSLPKPAKEWVNLSIFIQGPDGMAAMTRTNNSNSGHGYSTWFQPPAGSKAQVQAGGGPTEDRNGRLRLVRVGKELRYYACARGQSFRQIAAYEFGDRPIETLAFQVLAPALKAPVDVEYDNISVKADRFTGLVYVPPIPIGPVTWIIGGSVVVVLAGVWWWSTRRRR
jgi:Protein of unknown function (DUF1583) C domain